MDKSDEIVSLLTQIRDAQRVSIEENRNARTEMLARDSQARELQREAIANQKISMATQERHLKLYRRAIGAIIAFIVFAACFVGTLLIWP